MTAPDYWYLRIVIIPVMNGTGQVVPAQQVKKREAVGVHLVPYSRAESGRQRVQTRQVLLNEGKRKKRSESTT